jgi:hypothetical protein
MWVKMPFFTNIQLAQNQDKTLKTGEQMYCFPGNMLHKPIHATLIATGTP